jgi:transposase
VKHLDLFGRPTEIVVKCRRFKCRDCGKTFVQPLVGIMPCRRSTQVLWERVYRQHDDDICGCYNNNVEMVRLFLDRGADQVPYRLPYRVA